MTAHSDSNGSPPDGDELTETADGDPSPHGEGLVEVGRDATLCDAIDRLLNRGAVVAGDVVVSVADVDLVYLNLRVLLTSVETVRGAGSPPSESQSPTTPSTPRGGDP